MGTDLVHPSASNGIGDPPANIIYVPVISFDSHTQLNLMFSNELTHTWLSSSAEFLWKKLGFWWPINLA